MNLNKLVFCAALSFSITAFCDDPDRWGMLQCDSVTQSEAVQFATDNHFLDNYDWSSNPIGQEPPYVAPSATLTCSLPLAMRAFSDHGILTYRVDSEFRGSPYPVPVCVLSYFDGTPTEVFQPSGMVDGYLSPDPNEILNSVAVHFADSSGKSKFEDMMAIEVSATSKVFWISGIPKGYGLNNHVPIVSRCQVNF